MGQENSRLTELGPSESSFCLTDVSIERTDQHTEHRPSLNLTELCILGLLGSDEGKHLSLSKTASGRWETQDFIELHGSADGIVCIVKCDEGENEDLAFLHLKIEPSGLDSGLEYTQEMDSCDEQVHLTMSWRWLEQCSESVIAATDNPREFHQTGDPEMLTRNHFAPFVDRMQITDDPGELSQGISALQHGLEFSPDELGRPMDTLVVLGMWLHRRFELTGHLSDLSGSISSFEKAAKLSPETEEHLPAILDALGSCIGHRFMLTGDFSDMNQGIAAHQKALKLIPHGDPDRHTILSNLGLSFALRFNRLGDMSDLAEAISAQQKAVHIAPDGDPDLPRKLSSLGSCFKSRFELTGELSDIAEAISAQQRAIDLAPPGDQLLPKVLSSLANSLRVRFCRTDDVADMSRAISAQERAIELTPEGHPDLPAIFGNLGISYSCRFAQTEELSDLTQSVTMHRQSLQLTPEASPELPGRLHNLGKSLAGLWMLTGDAGGICHAAEAISIMRRGVRLTPEGHAELPTLLYALGTVLEWRYESTNLGCLEDLDESITTFKRAAHCTFGPSRTRLNAAKSWARQSKLRGVDSLDILAAYDSVIGLIALIAGLEQTVQGRYTQLREVSGLALEAAASAFFLEEPEKSLEWLEAGRCLVWSQLNNLRTPLDDLRAHDKLLAQRIETLSRQLENAGSAQKRAYADMSLPQKISLEDDAHTQLKLARQWDDLLRTVRAIPGFEAFLQPTSCSTLLQNLPESGPIVVINVAGERCDAIALIAGLDEPLHIPLLDFSLTKANKYRRVLGAQLMLQGFRMRETDAELLERALKSYTCKREAGKEAVCQVLQGLWVEVVKPILDALGFSKVKTSSGDQPPRIWWCPTGPLSFLPIHAAGVYRGPHQECALDYAVSSYTPTVTAVTNRVRHLRPIDDQVSGLFLTSQPSAPGASRIPGTTAEVQLIYEKALENKARVRRLEGTAVTIDECLAHMETYSCIHLACHASQNASDPLQSRFLFHNGSLDLGTIIQKNLKNADLAFLSACQTSTGEEKLSDEAVHLAAGMIAAGYRRVVATMWSIGDRHAPEVANNFYEYLWSHGEGGSGTGFDGSRSAHALHHAIQQLRLRLDNSENSLLTWIPYVHFGY